MTILVSEKVPGSIEYVVNRWAQFQTLDPLWTDNATTCDLQDFYKYILQAWIRRPVGVVGVRQIPPNQTKFTENARTS